MISVPAIITPTEASASETLCKKAALMFRLLLEPEYTITAVMTSTTKATPATMTTVQPSTGCGDMNRFTASTMR